MIAIKTYRGAERLEPVRSGTRASRDDPRNEPAIVHIVDADDDAAYLSALLAQAGLGSQSYSALGEFLSAEQDDAPGCLVVDARMVRENWRSGRAPALLSGVRCPIVIIAQNADIPTAVLAMKTGAIDFVEKPLREPEILGAVEAAIRVDRDRRHAAWWQVALCARFKTLSPREQQVMSLVTGGRMNKQIAGALGIREVTVKVHRGAAMRKMGARTVVDLVRMADAIGEPAIQCAPGERAAGRSGELAERKFEAAALVAPATIAHAA